MGSSASKPEEPVIFYNPNVPLQFSTGLVQNLEKKAEQTTEKTQARQVEALVQQRVVQELEKIQQSEAQLKEKFHVALEDNVNVVDNTTNIQAMIDRISRTAAKELSPAIKKAQEEVVVCYNNNKSRTLDCWKQVENFKHAVTEEQKKFVGAHQ